LNFEELIEFSLLKVLKLKIQLVVAKESKSVALSSGDGLLDADWRLLFVVLLISSHMRMGDNLLVLVRAHGDSRWKFERKGEIGRRR